MRTAVLLIAVLATLVGASPVAAQAVDDHTDVALGASTVLRVEHDPFRLVLVADGEEVLATRSGASAPLAATIDLTQPVSPAGSFPGLGWVLGPRLDATIPASFFQGNRLFGVEVGAVATVTTATPTATGGDTVTFDLGVDLPGVTGTSLTVEPLTGGGVELALTGPADVPVSSTVVSLDSPTDEGLFGLGARKDAFDQRGRLRDVWTEQQNSGAGPLGPIAGPTLGEEYTFPNGAQAAYFVQSFLTGSRGWSAWIANSELQRLDLAATDPGTVRWATAAADVDLHLAAGGLEHASRAFTADQGRAPAPPTWVYGNWIDVLNEGEGDAAPNGAGFSGGERVRADVEEVAAQAETLDLPVDVIGMEGWDEIPDIAALAGRLRDDGYRLSAYWNMFTAPEAGEPYDRALAEGLFITDRVTGEPYPIVTNRQNRSFLVDYSAEGVVDYWTDQLRRHAELGFEGFMHDFGELITEQMTFASGTDPFTFHNRYPVLYHEAARSAIDAFAADDPTYEPWFYVRAGAGGFGDRPGAQASTSGVFPGDETTDWDEGSGLPSVIPTMLNLALGGLYSFTTDVGGYLDLYTPRTTPELLARWHQLAVFTPMSRIHNSTGNTSLFPWEAGDEVVDVYRRYGRANRLLAELKDDWSRRAAADGTIGPVRPLVLVDNAPEARRDDQWLLGDDLLVAPVVTEGATARDVYLPAGSRWERVTVGQDGRFVRTGEVDDGGRVLADVPAPLADIPLFLRVGGDDPQSPAAPPVPGGDPTDPAPSTPAPSTPAPSAPSDAAGGPAPAGGASLPATGAGVGLAAAVAAVTAARRRRR